MKQHRLSRVQTVIFRLILMAVALLAQPSTGEELLGLYVGGGVGESQITLERFPAGASNPVSFSEHATGWKALVGFRPWTWIGAEIEYADLGHATRTLCCAITATSSGVPAAVKASGPALFGIAYLPPVAMFDLYGKVGFNYVRTRGDTNAVGVVGVDTCYFAPATLGCRAYRDDRQETSLAWGGGVAIKLSAFSVRAEYERLGTGSTRPGMASLIGAWTF